MVVAISQRRTPVVRQSTYEGEDEGAPDFYEWDETDEIRGCTDSDSDGICESGSGPRGMVHFFETSPFCNGDGSCACTSDATGESCDQSIESTPDPTEIVGPMSTPDQGCYSPANNRCDCWRDYDDCTQISGIWTDGCRCDQRDGGGYCASNAECTDGFECADFECLIPPPDKRSGILVKVRSNQAGAATFTCRGGAIATSRNYVRTAKTETGPSVGVSNDASSVDTNEAGNG